MKRILLAFSLLWIGHSKAQQSVNASGKSDSGSGGSISYTVGQIDYKATTTSSGTLSQGVQQAFEIYLLGTDEFPNMKLQAVVYPNPTVSSISLSITEYNLDKLQFHLFDIQGKNLLQQKIMHEETIISLEHLALGTYILRVSEEDKLLKSFKIIKK